MLQPLSRLPASADAYRHLDPAAILFDRIEIRSNRQPNVCVLIPSISAGLSAGPMTGLRFGSALAKAINRPMRVITVDILERDSASKNRDLRDKLDSPDMPIDHVGAGAQTTASADDIWIATYWTTALALDVAARHGIVDTSSVVYLIQDYEPGFSPWSTQWAATRSTYHAGFHHVVNSQPLARYLCEQEGPIVDRDLVMAPDLDLRRLEQVALSRENGKLGVFFYARPNGRPRNLYPLGLAAANLAARQTERPWRLVLAGQPVPAPRIHGIEVESLGWTSTDGYYDLMKRTTVALSLMMSPHPSHPPLDWAVSGGWSVTNRFGDSRDGLHPRLLAAEADPAALAQLLSSTIDEARAAPFLPPPLSLGRAMSDVIESLLELLV